MNNYHMLWIAYHETVILNIKFTFITIIWRFEYKL